MCTASSEQRASWSLTGSRALRSAASFRATAGEISGRWRPTGTRRRSCVDRVRARRRGDAVASASHLHKSGGRAVEIAGERRLDGRPPHRLAQGASRGRLLMGSGIAGRAIGRSRETLVTSPKGQRALPSCGSVDGIFHDARPGRGVSGTPASHRKLDAACYAPRDPRPSVSELHHELAGVLPVEQHVDRYGQLLEPVDDGLLRRELPLGHPPGEPRDDLARTPEMI
jgi:hypothetical protein